MKYWCLKILECCARFLWFYHLLNNTHDVKEATIRTPWHHQELPTLAWLEYPKPWRKHWAPVQWRSNKNAKHPDVSCWFIVYLLPIIFYHHLSYTYRVGAVAILQRDSIAVLAHQVTSALHFKTFTHLSSNLERKCAGWCLPTMLSERCWASTHHPFFTCHHITNSESPAIELWARWAVPKASLQYTSASFLPFGRSSKTFEGNLYIVSKPSGL